MNYKSFKLLNSMSGDNMYGTQPLKFYSEHLTITKISLIEHSLRNSSNDINPSQFEEKFKEWEKLINK